MKTATHLANLVLAFAIGALINRIIVQKVDMLDVYILLSMLLFSTAIHMIKEIKG